MNKGLEEKDGRRINKLKPFGRNLTLCCSSLQVVHAQGFRFTGKVIFEQATSLDCFLGVDNQVLETSF